jgi:DNA mismatch repair ATPase MutS
MTEESLEERLERLKAKQESGEELTDEEIQQLKADLQHFNEAMSSLAETFIDGYSDMLRDMASALQPVAEAVGEIDKETSDKND